MSQGREGTVLVQMRSLGSNLAGKRVHSFQVLSRTPKECIFLGLHLGSHAVISTCGNALGARGTYVDMCCDPVMDT